jgi:AbrB family looped-hinge helix DNA binding protein
MVATWPNIIFESKRLIVDEIIRNIKRQEDMGKTLLKIKKWSQVTLPMEIRTELNVSEADYLEMEKVEGGILLRPVVFQQKEVVGQV